MTPFGRMGRRRAPDPLEIASRWWAELQEGGGDPQQRAELERWLASDVAHRAAFEQVASAWRTAGALRPLARLERPRAAWAGRGRGAGEHRPWGRRAVLAGMASVASATAGLLLLPRGERLSLRTKGGQVRQVDLPDHSTLALSPRSAAEVRYSDQGREIELDGGEAWFEVQPDAARPFVVRSGPVAAHCAGATAPATQFSVGTAEAEIRVAVASGRVLLSLDAPGSTGPVELAAGQRAIVSGGALAVNEVAPALVGAWRQGRLMYQDERLALVLADIERFSGRRVRVAEPALGAIRLTGAFPLADPDAMVRSIGAALRLEIAGEPDGLVLRRPA